MVHVHNIYPVPQFTSAQLETLTAICDTLFQAHSGEEAAAIRARLPEDCPEWQRAKGRCIIRGLSLAIIDVQSMRSLHTHIHSYPALSTPLSD